jgi:hypothetical protein
MAYDFFLKKCFALDFADRSLKTLFLDFFVFMESNKFGTYEKLWDYRGYDITILRFSVCIFLESCDSNRP